MGKRSLQIATGILGVVPVVTGLIGMLGLHDPFYAPPGVHPDTLLDSNLRFLSGVWLGLGITVFWLIPRIEAQTTLFRVIWGAIFIGGIGRLLSMIFLALPPAPFIGFTVLEVVGAPLFVAWQARIASRARSLKLAVHASPDLSALTSH